MHHSRACAPTDARAPPGDARAPPGSQHLLVSSSADGWLVFYDVTKRAKLREIDHGTAITGFSLSHDSLYIACGAESGRLSLYDLRCADDKAAWVVQARLLQLVPKA